jgi:hypothetical protein
MKRCLGCLLPILFSILLTHPVLAQEAPVSSGHRSWLDSYRSAYSQAVLEETVDPLVTRLSDNVRLMPPYHASVFGRNNARAYYAAFLERFDVRQYQRVEVKTFDLGLRLMEVGRFTMSLTARGDARLHEISGSYMDIWEVAAGKPSTLLTQVWNTDSYPAIANDLRISHVPGVRTAFEARVPVKDSLSFELAALNKLHEVAITQADAKVWSLFFADDAVLLRKARYPQRRHRPGRPLHHRVRQPRGQLAQRRQLRREHRQEHSRLASRAGRIAEDDLRNR